MRQRPTAPSAQAPQATLPPFEEILRRGGLAGATVHELPGGASTRRYFRAVGAGDARGVIMWVPEAHVSEEATQRGVTTERWPFVEVQALLAERGVAVPSILAQQLELGLLLVEDLGDETLATFLEANPNQREQIYRAAVLDLARAQLALESLPPDSLVARRAFDEELLGWEIDHFREWALERRGVSLTPVEDAEWRRFSAWLARAVAALPRGFVHRDYQSRNLMVRRGGDGAAHLTWIDFQDALMGPRVYDLVALLGDSYQTFTAEFVAGRLDDYALARGLDEPERRALTREHALVTVQRKLKDAGRFVFIEHKKGDPSFLAFVEPTIAKVRAALATLSDLPECAAFEGLLAALVERRRVD